MPCNTNKQNITNKKYFGFFGNNFFLLLNIASLKCCSLYINVRLSLFYFVTKFFRHIVFRLIYKYVCQDMYVLFMYCICIVYVLYTYRQICFCICFSSRFLLSVPPDTGLSDQLEVSGRQRAVHKPKQIVDWSLCI